MLTNYDLLSLTFAFCISLIWLTYRLNYLQKLVNKIRSIDEQGILLPSFSFFILPFIFVKITNFIFNNQQIINIYPNQIIKLIFEILRTLCTIGTLIIAFISYKKYIQNKLLEQQLNKVIELIQLISEFYFLINFYSPKQLDLEKLLSCKIEPIISKPKYKLDQIKINLFELTRNFTTEKKKLITLFNDIYLTDKIGLKFNQIGQLSNDPLIPKTIAKSLEKFIIISDDYIVGSQEIKESYNIGNIAIKSVENSNQTENIINISMFRNENTGIAWTSWESFMRCSNDLYSAIKKWMSNNGITEINL